jgi:hypothetical protein
MSNNNQVTEVVIPEGQKCQEATTSVWYRLPNGATVLIPGGYKAPPELDWIKSTGTDDCPHSAVGVGVLSILATGVEGRLGYVCAGHRDGELPTLTLEEIEAGRRKQ